MLHVSAAWTAALRRPIVLATDSQEELMAFMRAVNPCVDWTETQWGLIVDEASIQSLPLHRLKMHAVQLPFQH